MHTSKHPSNWFTPASSETPGVISQDLVLGGGEVIQPVTVMTDAEGNEVMVTSAVVHEFNRNGRIMDTYQSMLFACPHGHEGCIIGVKFPLN